MPYVNSYEEQAHVLFDHFKQAEVHLNEKSKALITHCLKEAYENGYADGREDEDEITEKPISG
ncbi:hypothetical protein GCM10011391_08300 [Pullulanibacillus camelliae]|uniref:Uncharacterized protein n=1 Tax=Pullulanibacillus camelliae TaxID=1707096 RepID=A0A8J2YFE7_9BACL|nr:hypothetical protein [Pullulanibacillus camelliae]GGE32012.1 hypothetical protein GCM10011391_08300 [Pullulanibacillus camelliae]